jgi:hypothetical protein
VAACSRSCSPPSRPTEFVIYPRPPRWSGTRAGRDGSQSYAAFWLNAPPPNDVARADRVTLLRLDHIGAGFNTIRVRMARSAGTETFNPPLANEVTQIAVNPLRITLLLAEQRLCNLLRGERRSFLLSRAMILSATSGGSVSLRNLRSN